MKFTLLGCNLLSSDDQVTLILAVLVVDDNHEFAFSEILYGFFYCVQLDIIHILSYTLFIIYISNSLLLLCQFLCLLDDVLARQADVAQVAIEAQAEAYHAHVEEGADGYQQTCDDVEPLLAEAGVCGHLRRGWADC